MTAFANADALRAYVKNAVYRTPAFDMHTHLYDPRFPGYLLSGPDEMLTYHYLLAEFFRANPVANGRPLPPAGFYALPKSEQANLVWRELYQARSPVSESARGLLSAFDNLGYSTNARELDAYRRHFSSTKPDAYLDAVFAAANMEAAVMTNDPFDDNERAVWDKQGKNGGDPRFIAALRIDPLLVGWPTARPRLAGWGYKVAPEIDDATLAEVRRFLNDWIGKMGPVYMACSLPDTFDPETPGATRDLLRGAVLPVCRDNKLPFAMMVGVKRGQNPQLILAGDGVGRASLDGLGRMAAAWPENKFLLTFLSRENQHEACVLARKFGNIHLFGCWWYTNYPETINEITRMRLEMLGLTFTPQHSDARVLEQVIYKWNHTRVILAAALADKYADLWASGWRATDAEIDRDVKALLGGNFKRFVGMEK